MESQIQAALAILERLESRERRMEWLERGRLLLERFSLWIGKPLEVQLRLDLDQCKQDVDDLHSWLASEPKEDK